MKPDIFKRLEKAPLVSRRKIKIAFQQMDEKMEKSNIEFNVKDSLSEILFLNFAS